MELPEFSDDSTEQELDGDDDPLSNSSVKAAVKWENRDGEYVLLWWQGLFYIATENGGYSMTKSLFDKIPDHIEQIWVADNKRNLLSKFTTQQYEDEGVIIGEDDERFDNVSPSTQIAVDSESALETVDLHEVDI